MSDILQEAETLIEKHATSGYIHRDATLLLPGLVEEIKHLQADNDFLHKFVDDPGSTLEAALNAVREQLEVIRKQQAAFADAIKTAAATLTKWQKIAIKQRALINFIETEERYAYSEHVILSDDEILIAAKELDLQLAQETGHVERLEKEFLDHAAARIYYESIPGVSDYWSWHDYPEEPCQMRPKQWFRDRAQAALEKIRRGQT